jgi:hypothetical protein
MTSKRSIIAMSDKHPKLRIDKGELPHLPMRMIITGKSQASGKSTLIGNLLLRPYDDTDVGGKDFYKNDFVGKDIYMISESLHLDDKLQAIIKGKEIPEMNCLPHYDEEQLIQIYDNIEKNFNEAIDEGRKPVHSLWILDDIAYTGALKDKMHGILAKVFANSRHILLSVVVTSQKYSSIQTLLRENASCCIFFECSAKQAQLISEDHATTSTKEFEKMLRRETQQKHSFLVINYNNPIEKRFMNSHFEPVSIS